MEKTRKKNHIKQVFFTYLIPDFISAPSDAEMRGRQGGKNEAKKEGGR
jgi:hypothetical protein